MPFKMIDRVFDVSYKRSFYHTPSIRTRKCLTYVLGAGHYHCSSTYKICREGYNCYLLLLTVSGCGRLIYENKEYDLSPNHIFLIDCNYFHKYFTYPGAHWEIKWVHFHGGGSGGYFRYITESIGSVFCLSSTDEADTYLSTLIDLLEHKNFQFDFNASLLVTQLLTLLLDPSFNKTLNSLTPINDKTMEAVIEYIEKNHTEKITITELAAISRYSKFYFLRLFKKHIGVTPYEFLLTYRLNKSKELLMQSKYSIEEISNMVGFESVSNYIKHFKRYEGITPARHRMQSFLE